MQYAIFLMFFFYLKALISDIFPMGMKKVALSAFLNFLIFLLWGLEFELVYPGFMGLIGAGLDILGLAIVFGTILFLRLVDQYVVDVTFVRRGSVLVFVEGLIQLAMTVYIAGWMNVSGYQIN